MPFRLPIASTCLLPATLLLGGCARSPFWHGAGSECLTIASNRAAIIDIEKRQEDLARDTATAGWEARRKEAAALEDRKADLQRNNESLRHECRPPEHVERRDPDRDPYGDPYRR